MLEAFNGPQLVLLAIMVVAFGLLITEKLRNDLVAVLIIITLSATHLLEPEEALAGLGSEAAVVVAAIFVLSAGMHHTGLSETLGGWIGRLAGSGYTRVVGVIMPSVALLSAFTHHLTTTAVMLPITLKLAREREIQPSKLLMPLSFAASLGTTITIIGAPAFLIASSVLQQTGRPGLGILSIAPIGLSITLLGTLFMVLAGRFILPSRGGGDEAENRFRLDEYFTEFTVLGDSPFLGKPVKDVEEDDRHQMQVVGLVRGGRRLSTPLEDRKLKEGDVLLVRTTPEDLVTIRQEPGVELHPVSQYGPGEPEADGHAQADDGDVVEQLVQAVVAPDSPLAGRTIGEVDFRKRYGAIVLSLWRREGWLDDELAQIRLQPGDVLVLQGSEESLRAVAEDPAFLMLVPFHGESQPKRKAPVAGIIMVATVAAAAFNVLAIEIAAVAGAVAMIITGCLSVRQAYQAVDARIYVFIAGAIPLGAAMQKTGLSELLGGWLQQAMAGWTQTLVLLAIFAVVAVITQFMSDAATTALFGPVAVAMAQGLGAAPEAYVVTVAMAAVASFLTPIGHHGNLLVYGPGRYRFTDFVKAGTPLTIIVGLVVAFMAPMLWPSQ